MTTVVNNTRTWNPKQCSYSEFAFLHVQKIYHLEGGCIGKLCKFNVVTLHIRIQNLYVLAAQLELEDAAVPYCSQGQM